MLIVLIDIDVQSFDLVNDIIGILMIAHAVKLLAALNQGSEYRRVMRLVRIAAILSCFSSFFDQFAVGPPVLVATMFAVIDLVAVFAIVMFCHAMYWLCLEEGLWRSAVSWQKSARLVAWMYLRATGAFLSIGLLNTVWGHTVRIQLESFLMMWLKFFNWERATSVQKMARHTKLRLCLDDEGGRVDIRFMLELEYKSSVIRTLKCL